MTTSVAAAPELRRQFRLPEDDEKALKARGSPWEAVIENGQRWVIIHNYPVCAGYNHSTVQAAILISTGYPDVQLDMVYFYPSLQRSDGQPVRNLATLTFNGQIWQLDGKIWQQWSRHRTPVNPWRPGLDNLDTHMRLVDHWLAREFENRR